MITQTGLNNDKNKHHTFTLKSPNVSFWRELSPSSPPNATRDLGLLVAELAVDIRLPLFPRLIIVISPEVLIGVVGGHPRAEDPKTTAAAW